MNITPPAFELNPLQLKNETAEVDGAAQKLENHFAYLMIKSMRQASFGDPLFPQQNSTFRDMYDQKLADSFTKDKGLGLAAVISQQLKTSNKTNLLEGINSGTGMPLQKPAKFYPLQTPSPALSLPVSQSNSMGINSSNGTNKPAFIPLNYSAKSTEGSSFQSQSLSRRLNSSAERGGYSTPTIANIYNKKLERDALRAQGGYGARPMYAQPSDGASVAGNSIAKTNTTADQFVSDVWPHAIQAAQELGVDPRALVAQAALETGWGKRVIQKNDGSTANNYFGIKATGWKGDKAITKTHEVINGVRRSEQAAFRAYQSPAESFSDYVRLLKTNPRYQQALNAGQNINHFASSLQQAGYATDPTYAKKITAIAYGPTLTKSLAQLANSNTNPNPIQNANPNGIPDFKPNVNQRPSINNANLNATAQVSSPTLRNIHSIAQLNSLRALESLNSPNTASLNSTKPVNSPTVESSPRSVNSLAQLNVIRQQNAAALLNSTTPTLNPARKLIANVVNPPINNVLVNNVAVASPNSNFNFNSDFNFNSNIRR